MSGQCGESRAVFCRADRLQRATRPMFRQRESKRRCRQKRPSRQADDRPGSGAAAPRTGPARPGLAREARGAPMPRCEASAGDAELGTFETHPCDRQTSRVLCPVDAERRTALTARSAAAPRVAAAGPLRPARPSPGAAAKRFRTRGGRSSPARGQRAKSRSRRLVAATRLREMPRRLRPWPWPRTRRVARRQNSARGRALPGFRWLRLANRAALPAPSSPPQPLRGGGRALRAARPAASCAEDDTTNQSGTGTQLNAL